MAFMIQFVAHFNLQTTQCNTMHHSIRKLKKRIRKPVDVWQSQTYQSIHKTNNQNKF